MRTRLLIILMAFAFWPLFLIIKAVRRKMEETATRREQARVAAQLRKELLNRRFDPFDDEFFFRSSLYGYPYRYPYGYYRPTYSPNYMMWAPIWFMYIVIILIILAPDANH